MRRRMIRPLILLLAAAWLGAAPGTLRAAAPTSTPATREELRIKEGDRLEVRIKGLEAANEFSSKRLKVEGGRIQMPLLEPTRVEGLTLDEASDRVADAYNAASIIRKGTGQISMKRVAPSAEEFAALTADDPIISGERVSVTVTGLYKVGEPTTLVRRLGPSGEMDLPVIHGVKLVGLTEAQAAEKVAAAYDLANVIRSTESNAIVVLPDRGESFRPLPAAAPKAADPVPPAAPLVVKVAPAPDAGEYQLLASADGTVLITVYLNKGDDLGFRIAAGELIAVGGPTGTKTSLPPDGVLSWKLSRRLKTE